MLFILLIKIGVMQNYFEQTEFGGAIDNRSLQLSFIETIYNVLINLVSPFVQIMMIYLNPRWALLISVVLCTLGLTLAGSSTEIWHLYLTHGVLYGAGSSMIFYLAFTIIPKWFDKHRNIALGIVSCGSSIGGLVTPLIMEPLNTHLGYGWCYRITGFICLFVGIVSFGIFRNKARSESEVITKLKDIFDFGIVKDWRFLLWCLIEILFESAYNVPYYFLPSYATYCGLTSSQGATILSVCSGSNALGRLVAGGLADYIGQVNIIIVYSIFTGLSSLILWPQVTTFEGLISFAIIFGFFGGAFITLTPSITVLITGLEKLDTGLSVYLIITSCSLFGPNYAQLIEAGVQGLQPFQSYTIFTGTGYLAGAALLISLKFILGGTPLSRM
ncbi:major facilitator superfamily domain-containing protein [Pilobolus umbonatus]|nr:major facilitator superfamily domain-containing protein [Pilobolus umbonatus]